MDLASKSSTPKATTLAKLLLYLPALFLIGSIVQIGFTSQEIPSRSYSAWELLQKEGAFVVFIRRRNLIYLGYTLVLIVLGFSKLTRSLQDKMRKGLPTHDTLQLKTPSRSLIPAVVGGILLTTFSYAIASIILDAYVILAHLKQKLW